MRLSTNEPSANVVVPHKNDKVTDTNKIIIRLSIFPPLLMLNLSYQFASPAN